MLFDSHAHVHTPEYDADRAEVMKRASEAGVMMVTIGTTLRTSKMAIATAKEYGVYAAVGLHPNFASGQNFTDEPADEIQRNPQGVIRHVFDYEKFAELVQDQRVVAIGETGLDYFHWPSDRTKDEAKALQKTALELQVSLAKEVGKPLVMHCRDAHADLLGCIDEFGIKHGVIHCFSGGASEASEYVKRGLMISIAGVVTFPAKKSDPARQKSLWQAIRETPLAQLMIETDCPYLTPAPHRGERNEPAYVRFTAEKIAELKNLSFDEVATATTQNAKRLFHIET